jgi:hypothetical protein
MIFQNTTSHLPDSIGYKGSNVKEGKGGFVKIRGFWLALNVRPDLYDDNEILMLSKSLTVEKLAWGNTFLGDLDDYVKEYRITAREVELLKTTLTDEERWEAEDLNLL